MKKTLLCLLTCASLASFAGGKSNNEEDATFEKSLTQATNFGIPILKQKDRADDHTIRSERAGIPALNKSDLEGNVRDVKTLSSGPSQNLKPSGMMGGLCWKHGTRPNDLLNGLSWKHVTRPNDIAHG